MSDKIRKARVAGLFYSKQKATLEKEVAVFLENSKRESGVNKIYGLVAPHAGYLYSGGVAARAYRQIVNEDFELIVVISPSHKMYFDEISVYNGNAYQTPLGDVKVDQESAKKLVSLHPDIIYSDFGHEIDEHALEVQIPFLQQALYEFKLLPVVMGNQDSANVEILANALAELLKDKNALIVASSDLSHFHNQEQAKALDNIVVETVAAYDYDSLAKNLQEGSCEMCGGGPVLVTMKACQKLGAKKSKVLFYRNSGDVTGEHDQVVGYMSAMFYS